MPADCPCPPAPLPLHRLCRSAKKWGDVEFPLPFGRTMTPQVRCRRRRRRRRFCAMCSPPPSAAALHRCLLAATDLPAPACGS